LTRLQRYY